MHKILQNHLLCAFVANLKIGAIYALYPESFCDKNLAIWKVFAFCDSGTIFLCSLDVRNIDDQCRGPSIKEKDHLAGYVTKSPQAFYDFAKSTT